MENDTVEMRNESASVPAWLQLVPARTTEAADVFGFSEYLAALALMLVVVTVSDFRFRYRLTLHRCNLRLLGVWVGLGGGAILLIIDIWFANRLPLPTVLNNEVNLKAALGSTFLLLVFYTTYVAFIAPPVFQLSNAKKFFLSTAHYIHQGDAARLQVIAEELGRSSGRIIKSASDYAEREAVRKDMVQVPDDQIYGNAFLFLLADARFCRVVVQKEPSLALFYFLEAEAHIHSGIPFSQFARNIGQEFIRNTESAFYLEVSGYESGFFGYEKPLTRAIFGQYRLVERCASDGASPLDTFFVRISDFNGRQMEGYCRAYLAFFEAYLQSEGIWSHSYAFVRALSSLESALVGTYRLEMAGPDFYRTSEYERLEATVECVRGSIKLLEEHAEKPRRFRKRAGDQDNLFDRIAELVFEVILASSAVSEPVWTCWQVQHNAVWSGIFWHDGSVTMKIIQLNPSLALRRNQEDGQVWRFQRGAYSRLLP